ncbi:MAG: ABC transporter permease subunit, partial [Hyphomicrobium sp.]
EITPDVIALLPESQRTVASVAQRPNEAASTLGANRAWTFLLVTLPLALPGLLAGAILCFAKALGEFGATITFVSNIPGETRTISSAIYSYTQVPGGDDAAIRLMLVSTAIALAAMVISELLNRRMQRRIAVFER